MSLLRTAFAVRRGSGSFIADSMAMDDSSPAARLDARYPEQPRPLHTPAPPAAEAQRSGSGEAAHGPDSSSSSLSGAATSRAPLAAGLAGDPWGGGDMPPALRWLASAAATVGERVELGEERLEVSPAVGRHAGCGQR